jgi:hypothetical protein
MSSSLQPLFDGVGSRSTVWLSTEGVTLSGDVRLNKTGMPTGRGVENQILKLDTDGNIVFADLYDEWTRESGFTILPNGTYSSSRMTIANGYITNIVNNPRINTFFMRKASPAPGDYIKVITNFWKNPAINDIAFVHNLENNTAYRIVYTGATASGWEITETI